MYAARCGTHCNVEHRNSHTRKKYKVEPSEPSCRCCCCCCVCPARRHSRIEHVSFQLQSPHNSSFITSNNIRICVVLIAGECGIGCERLCTHAMHYAPLYIHGVYVMYTQYNIHTYIYVRRPLTVPCRALLCVHATQLSETV